MRSLLIGTVAIAALFGVGWLIDSGQQKLRADRPMLPVTFAHKDHRKENCIACHHNFVDSSGQGLCFDCHKTDPTVNALIETQFHDLCRGCHLDKQLSAEEGGPTRQCIECHTADEAP